MNPSDSEDPAAFHLRNKHELLYECRFVGQYVPDKEYRSAKPDILYRKTENKGTVLHEEHIFRGRLSKLMAGIRGVFSCLRNRDVKFRKRQKQIPDTG